MPLVGDKFSSVWLGGQDEAEEGRWVWTSAGNQTLAKDLLWELGKVLSLTVCLFTFENGVPLMR